MSHRKRRVWKERQGSRRGLIRKEGRRRIHLYQHMDDGRFDRPSVLRDEGKQ